MANEQQDPVSPACGATPAPGFPVELFARIWIGAVSTFFFLRFSFVFARAHQDALAEVFQVFFRR